MVKGLLWYENDTKKTLEMIVSEAVEYNKDKYNIISDVCYVNPKILAEEIKINNILVKPLKSILPNHYWVGNDKS